MLTSVRYYLVVRVHEAMSDPGIRGGSADGICQARREEMQQCVQSSSPQAQQAATPARVLTAAAQATEPRPPLKDGSRELVTPRGILYESQAFERN